MALETLKRCKAKLGGGECGSAVFYDWGIQLMDVRPMASIHGTSNPRWNDWAQTSNVKICVRCTTPYVIDAGELVDISTELDAEDVKAILARGQVNNPHPKIKDP